MTLCLVLSILNWPRNIKTSVTTRLPAVPDVFDSGRNVGALRQGRRVGFRSLGPGLADDICRGPIIFVTLIALEL